MDTSGGYLRPDRMPRIPPLSTLLISSENWSAELITLRTVVQGRRQRLVRRSSGPGNARSIAGLSGYRFPSISTSVRSTLNAFPFSGLTPRKLKRRRMACRLSRFNFKHLEVRPSVFGVLQFDPGYNHGLFQMPPKRRCPRPECEVPARFRPFARGLRSPNQQSLPTPRKAQPSFCGSAWERRRQEEDRPRTARRVTPRVEHALLGSM